MTNDVLWSPPEIWFQIWMHGQLRSIREWRKLVALLAKASPRHSSCFEKKFLAWHRARLTPLVDLELDAHGET
jgi:hypothetical protein